MPIDFSRRTSNFEKEVNSYEQNGEKYSQRMMLVGAVQTTDKDDRIYEIDKFYFTVDPFLSKAKPG